MGWKPVQGRLLLCRPSALSALVEQKRACQPSRVREGNEEGRGGKEEGSIESLQRQGGNGSFMSSKCGTKTERKRERERKEAFQAHCYTPFSEAT